MATHHRGFLLLLLLLGVAASSLLAAGAEGLSAAGGGIGFDLHHRYSPVVRQWAEARGHAAWWHGQAQAAGDRGSPEHYSALARHDRALFARRGLAGEGDGKGLLAFADGNATFQDLGSLHYAAVAVGTPNTTFLVALDTGSDLFWVPCGDCKSCAPTRNATAGPELRPYSPRESSTSKAVTCDSAFCDRPNACGSSGVNGSCPYSVQYVSANTSSSGVLVEDVLYLTRESRNGGGGEPSSVIKAPVVFGCGQEQTGDFLGGAAVDGLLGLGMDRVSVPSVLASSGLVASDSFSMCFSPDGVGRINFGDAGRTGQPETPFIVRNRHPTYNISVTAISVDGKASPAQFAAVVDSGTSFTYLNDPAYTVLTSNFNSQVQEKRANLSASIPFEFCYRLSRNQTDVAVPDVSLTTKGGAVFPVTDPIVVIVGRTSDGKVHLVGYCLAVLKNDIAIDIIGQNFMTGLKVVFDRQRSVLGWHEFDCYKNAATEEAASPAGAPPGTTALKPPRQNDDGSPTYPGAAPVPKQASGIAGSRALVGGFSFFSMMLLPLLAAAAAVV